MNCAAFGFILLIILFVTIAILMIQNSKKESYNSLPSYRGYTRDQSAPPLSPFITYKKYACPCNAQYILQQPYDFLI